jgi:bifunctional NMN adenylyltransferase/nudix hydrolase
MNNKIDQLVFIGRMQPPTVAHINIIKTALEMATNVTIILGSSFQARTIKNPWNSTERASMILNCIDIIDHPRLTIRSVGDYFNDQHWANAVQKLVPKNFKNTKLIGHKKDSSSFYLDMFPQWGPMVEIDNIRDINASDVRNEYFEGTLLNWHDFDVLPSGIQNYLRAWSKTPEYFSLVKEYKFIQSYKKSWEKAPYPPIFVTSDAVVVQSGHILLVQRRASPGKGLWALPGGFVNVNEHIFDAVIRELREETKLGISNGLMRGSFKRTQCFDKPNRSLRGRTITHAYLFELPNGKLPKVKGSDDALDAKWFSIDDIKNMQDQFFEDHYQIIEEMVGVQ